LNYLEHLADKYPEAHPLIICTTDYTCEVLESYHSRFGQTFTVLRDNSNFQCNAPRYLTRTVNLKYLYGYTLVKYGNYNVLLSDTDAAFLSDPFAQLEEPLDETGVVPDVFGLTDTGV